MNLRGAIQIMLHISMGKFIYYNYCCGNVRRDKGCRIYPYRGTHIQLARDARIELHGNMILNDCKIKGSRAECLILLRQGAKLEVNGEVQMYYGTTLQVHKDAWLTIGEVHMNTGSAIVCAKRMTIGQRVSMAREVFIFDSDHHPVYREGKRINEAKEVVVGDHVWLGLKSTVMKGANIGEGCVISAHSLVSGTIPAHTLVATAPARPVMKDITWQR